MNKSSSKYFFDTERSFSPDRCFVCDALLNDENRSEEHIYPKWLQRKFNLYNQEISLLNGTYIYYRNLKVPCCKSCNAEMSKKIEKPMEQAIAGGYDSFITLDKDIIFQWLNKLSYGMLYKETMLLHDRKNPNGGYIVPHEMLNDLHMKYIFLVSTIKDTEYILSPYSLLIFKIKPNPGIPYWGHDNLFTSVFCMNLNDIGIIAHLQDNKSNENSFKADASLNDLLKRELHYAQFREVCARFCYKSSLFIRNPSYVMIMDNDTPKQIISQEMSGIGYSDWDQEEYAKTLSWFWEDCGIPYHKIYKGEDKVLTLLRDENGSFIEIKD